MSISRRHPFFHRTHGPNIYTHIIFVYALKLLLTLYKMCTDGKKSPIENNDCVLYLNFLRLYGVQILGRYMHKKKFLCIFHIFHILFTYIFHSNNTIHVHNVVYFMFVYTYIPYV